VEQQHDANKNRADYEAKSGERRNWP